MLKTSKPLGIRELQRALSLSSPSVAQHHLSRLESVGLVKHEMGGYVINKVMLQNCIKISRFVIPRYFFYCLLSVFALVLELTYLQPNVLYQEYFFSVILTIVFLFIFCYETVKVWRKGYL
jgi:LexA DNA binding domain